MERLAESALTLLIVFVGLSMIIGGHRGGASAINMIVSSVRSYAERRIRAIILILDAIVAFHYLRVNLLHWR